MPSVVLEGRVTRRVGALTSDGNNTERYIEMYVHDAVFGHSGTEIHAPTITVTGSGCKIILPKSASQPEHRRVAVLFEHIYAYVRQHNDYVNGFLCAAEEMQNMDDHELQHTVLLLAGKRTHQQIRRDRAAQQTQFAGQTDAGEHGVLRSMPEMCVLCPRTVAANERSAILVNMRQGGGLQRIPIEHRAFDALYNVLLHPTGYVGWEDNTPLRTENAAYRSLPMVLQTVEGRARQRGSSALNPRTKLSMLDYYSYRLHFRRGPVVTENCMFMSSRLFQEYACVAFWRVETARLNIHRLRQQNQREARVNELRDHAQQFADTGEAEAIGRISYIPESFVGGPADMYAKYQDTMAVVLKRGPPSLFITMTANPKWREVQSSLAFDQTADQRFDIIARVFKAKLNALLDDLKAGMLGVQVARVYVIEFQKRGLPHAHIVVILAVEDRPRNGVHIDWLSSTEIPPLPAANDDSPEARVQRRLRSLVLEHMIHNDCSGAKGQGCPCYDESKQGCGGNFPFAFASETTIGDERQKSVLRRRRGDHWSATVDGRTITNQWVVSYNAALLLKYECHLNVEVVTATYAIKYLFKYLFKGSDNASAAIHAHKRVLDQIGRYQDHRYLGSAEAAWRLFKFSIHDLTDHVERMIVEIPEERYDNTH